MGRFGSGALKRCLGGGLLALGLAAVSAQETVFRIDVKLVPLLVTVRNAADDLIGGLSKDDFTILDNGVEQEIAVFERRTDQPLSVALLIDASPSTAIKGKEQVASIRRFLTALLQEGNPEDAVSLYAFNDEVTLLNSFTTRLALVEKSLKSLFKPHGGTSLYDAIYFAARELERRQGRKIVLVVTDGGDTTSAKTLKDALQAMHYADAVMFGILVIPVMNDPGRNVGGENALTLLASGTGGKIFFSAAGAELDQAFNNILEELRTQYYVGYYPANVPTPENRFHQVQVRVRDRELRVSTRSGYYETN